MKAPPKRKKPSSPPPPSPSFSLFPDEIAVDCLARIPRSYYPRLSIVSKSIRSILSSSELYAVRSHLGTTEQCLYVCLWDRSYQFPQWFTLWINPSRTLPNSSVVTKKRKKKKKKTVGQLLVPIPSSDFASLSKPTISLIGSEIYLIGGPVNKAPSSTVRVLDCRNHTWRDAPSMNVARKYALTCFYNGKIYVFGGCEDNESWVEVFDTKTQTWECLPDPGTEVRKLHICIFNEFEGKICIGNSKTMYAYDTKQGKWDCCEYESAMFDKLECVIENVSYRYDNGYVYGNYNFQWYDIKCGKWKDVYGLDSLREKHMRNGGSSRNRSKLVSCGGKLLLIWEGYMKHNPNNRKKIWCAQIVLEKHDGGEIWGNVEWVDVVHTVPTSCHLLHCLVVSV